MELPSFMAVAVASLLDVAVKPVPVTVVVVVVPVLVAVFTPELLLSVS